MSEEVVLRVLPTQSSEVASLTPPFWIAPIVMDHLAELSDEMDIPVGVAVRCETAEEKVTTISAKMSDGITCLFEFPDPNTPTETHHATIDSIQEIVGSNESEDTFAALYLTCTIRLPLLESLLIHGLVMKARE